jgi:uncharacterized coiled-coil DUF342 family protein
LNAEHAFAVHMLNEASDEIAELKELLQDYHTEVAIGTQLSDDSTDQEVAEWMARMDKLQKRAEQLMPELVPQEPHEEEREGINIPPGLGVSSALRAPGL